MYSHRSPTWKSCRQSVIFASTKNYKFINIYWPSCHLDHLFAIFLWKTKWNVREQMLIKVKTGQKSTMTIVHLTLFFQIFWSLTMALCEKQFEIRCKMLFTDNFPLLQSLQMLWSIAIITVCFIILALLFWTDARLIINYYFSPQKQNCVTFIFQNNNRLSL